RGLPAFGKSVITSNLPETNFLRHGQALRRLSSSSTAVASADSYPAQAARRAAAAAAILLGDWSCRRPEGNHLRQQLVQGRRAFGRQLPHAAKALPVHQAVPKG